MTSTAIARLAAALAVAFAGGASAASPQMYKCVENGRTVYQQQACNPQPQAEPVRPPASAASNASPATTTKVRRPSPASSAPAAPR